MTCVGSYAQVTHSFVKLLGVKFLNSDDKEDVSRRDNFCVNFTYVALFAELS